MEKLNGEMRETKFDFVWVITADSESVHYDPKYKSYLKRVYEQRPAFGGWKGSRVEQIAAVPKHEQVNR
jgi:hypothetical protein